MKVLPSPFIKVLTSLTLEEFKKVPEIEFTSITKKIIVNFLAIENQWDKVRYLISKGFPCNTTCTDDPRNWNIGFYNPTPIPIITPFRSAIRHKNGIEFLFLFNILNKDSSTFRILQQNYGECLENDFATGCFVLFCKVLQNDTRKVKIICDLFKQKNKRLDSYFVDKYLMPGYFADFIRDSFDFLQKEHAKNMVIIPCSYSGSEYEMEKYFDPTVIEFIKSRRVQHSKRVQIYHLLVIKEIADIIKSYLI